MVTKNLDIKTNVGKHQRNVKDNGKNMRRIVDVLKKINMIEKGFVGK